MRIRRQNYCVFYKHFDDSWNFHWSFQSAVFVHHFYLRKSEERKWFSSIFSSTRNSIRGVNFTQVLTAISSWRIKAFKPSSLTARFYIFLFRFQINPSFQIFAALPLRKGWCWQKFKIRRKLLILYIPFFSCYNRSGLNFHNQLELIC